MKILITAVMLLTTPLAFAGDELDNEQSVTNVAARIKDLPQTLIMRKNEKTGAVEVAHLKQAIGETQLSAAELNQIAFTEVAADEMYSQNSFNELDADNSRVSWYFYYGYAGYGYGYGYGYAYGYPYYPSYNYYGYSYAYRPYYNYNYYGYAYNYYRPYYGYWY